MRVQSDLVVVMDDRRAAQGDGFLQILLHSGFAQRLRRVQVSERGPSLRRSTFRSLALRPPRHKIKRFVFLGTPL